MPTTKIRPGATHYLAGIARDSGLCDHCGRTLKNLFVICDANGTKMVVGRSHAKQFTGYDATVREAERLQYLADRDTAYAAYLTRSEVGRRLDQAASAEPVGCEVAGPLRTARTVIATQQAMGLWDDALADALSDNLALAHLDEIR